MIHPTHPPDFDTAFIHALHIWEDQTAKQTRHIKIGCDDTKDRELTVPCE